jgi:hypothetical protein
MKYIILFLLFPSSWIFAEDFSGKNSMNDISFEEYKEFPSKWELVTIRFRKDTGEMRLTYANELAMKTLKSGSTLYPTGAVFAKTGVHTSSDPQFVSSVVPRGIRRYQLMVRNKDKYKTSGGWGYALFDPQGKTFAEEPKMTQDACYACHTIVENRGDVFSEPFDFVKTTKFPDLHLTSLNSQIKYVWVKVKSLPKNISIHLSKATSKIRSVKHHKLRSNVFQGTLDEMKPVLEVETRKSKSPALFASADNKRFVLVIPEKSDECVGEGAYKIISTDMNLKPLVEKFCTHD